MAPPGKPEGTVARLLRETFLPPVRAGLDAMTSWISLGPKPDKQDKNVPDKIPPSSTEENAGQAPATPQAGAAPAPDPPPAPDPRERDELPPPRPESPWLSVEEQVEAQPRTADVDAPPKASEEAIKAFDEKVESGEIGHFKDGEYTPAKRPQLKEAFGAPTQPPQDPDVPFAPDSPEGNLPDPEPQDGDVVRELPQGEEDPPKTTPLRRADRIRERQESGELSTIEDREDFYQTGSTDAYEPGEQSRELLPPDTPTQEEKPEEGKPPPPDKPAPPDKTTGEDLPAAKEDKADDGETTDDADDADDEGDAEPDDAKADAEPPASTQTIQDDRRDAYEQRELRKQLAGLDRLEERSRDKRTEGTEDDSQEVGGVAVAGGGLPAGVQQAEGGKTETDNSAAILEQLTRQTDFLEEIVTALTNTEGASV